MKLITINNQLYLYNEGKIIKINNINDLVYCFNKLSSKFEALISVVETNTKTVKKLMEVYSEHL